MKNITTVDLFCGCGGMSKGFINAGFNVVSAFDNWKPALGVYKDNFKHSVSLKNLTDTDSAEIIAQYHPELIVGGPPCQDFSTAGRRDEQGGRAGLTLTYANIIATIKPEMFVMENVPVIQKSSIYQEAVEIFRKAGYGLSQKVLDASLCGVPQSRKRFFMVGKLGAEDGFLDHYLTRRLDTKPMSIYDYLGDSLGVEYYFRIPTNYSRRAIFSIYEPCVTIRGIDRPIPKEYKKHPQDPVEIGPQVRALTIEERALIQTFPPNYMWSGTKSDLNQMIGNAVPVKLAEYVAKAIQEYCTEHMREGDSI